MASRLAAIMVLNLECMKHLSETVLQLFGSQIGSIKMFLQQQRKGFIFLGTVKRILYQNKRDNYQQYLNIYSSVPLRKCYLLSIPGNLCIKYVLS